jgi:hypothetical protein
MIATSNMHHIGAPELSISRDLSLAVGKDLQSRYILVLALESIS